MKRLVSAVLLTGALGATTLAPAGAAPGAAGPAGAAARAATCAGQEATIVGRPHQARLTGTAGPDVIVSNGATVVLGRGGDDVVCITGDTEAVRAGAGADDVHNLQTAATAGDLVLSVGLGAGADSFQGSEVPEIVETEPARGRADSPDVVATGGGDDWVTSGVWPRALADALDLGTGDDTAFLDGWTGSATFSLVGGDGRDRLFVEGRERQVGPLRSAAWVLDNRAEAGTATAGGTAQLAWTSFDSFTWWVPVGSTTFLGGAGDEDVTAPRLRAADLGAGNDVLQLDTAPLGGLIDGGAGADRLSIHPKGGIRCAGTATLDLAAGRYACRSRGARSSAGVERFETLRLAARVVDVTGSARGERLDVRGCGRVAMGAGADRVVVTAGSRCAPGRALRVLGGDGDDTLIGSNLPDVLLGGGGDDVADGRRGTDRCVAERRLRCER